VSTESAGPVSAPTHSLPVGGPPSSGGHGILGSAGPSQVGVSALGYPSGLADPPDSSMYTGGQMSTSLATAIVEAEVHAQLESSSSSTSFRQPPATAAAARLPPEGPTLAPNYDRPTRRAQSLSAHTPSFHSLSPPVLSPAYDVELSQSVPLGRGRAASSQRVVSPRARP